MLAIQLRDKSIVVSRKRVGTSVLFVTDSRTDGILTGKDWLSLAWLKALKRRHTVRTVRIDRTQRSKLREVGLRIAALCCGLPSIWGTFGIRGFLEVLGMIAGIRQDDGIDLVVVDHGRMGWAVVLIKALTDCSVLFVAHNVEYKARRSFAATSSAPWAAVPLVELPLLFVWERIITRLSDLTATPNADEHEFICAKFGAQSRLVFPPVDVGKALKGEKGSRRTVSSHGNKAGVTCLHVGSYGYRAKELNIRWFVGEVLPLLRKKWPNLALRIVGSGASPKLTKHLQGLANVEFLGQVESVYPYYQHADVCLVPEVVGGGFKMKVLEAASARVPIVAYPKAIEGMGLVAGKHYLAADSPREWRDQIDLLMEDAAVGVRITNNLYRLVRVRHSWKRFANEVSYVMEQLA